MTAFAAATNLMFRDKNMSVAAVYLASGQGAGQAVRVIRKSPDLSDSFADSRIVSRTTVLDVRVSEIAAPKAGDVFQIGSENLRVQGVPVRDALQLIWTLEAVPAP